MLFRTSLVWMVFVGIGISSSSILGQEATQKKEANAPRKEGNKNADPAKDEPKKLPMKVTANGLEFEVAASKMNGTNWELQLDVVCPEANSNLRITLAKAYTEDGKVYTAAFRPLSKDKISTDLPLGQKVRVKVNMGPIPANVNKLTTVELTCSGTRKASYPITFKNVTVER